MHTPERGIAVKTFKVSFKGRPVWLTAIAVAAALVIGILIPMPENARGPLVTVDNTILIAVLVALGGFVAQLYARMNKLEADVFRFRAENDGLRADLTAATTFIDRLGIWLLAGSPPDKTPAPAERLREHIDAELWNN